MTPSTNAAAAAGRATPESGEAPSRDQAAQGFRGQEQGTDTADGTEAPTERKRLATLRALLALHGGIELQEMADGSLQALAPGMVARFTDLCSAEAWCRLRNGASASPAAAGAPVGAGPGPAGRFAALQARLRLAGWHLAAGTGGAFTVSRWGNSRALDSLDAVDTFARQVGVKL
jgi:hypothetical protein